MTKQSKLTTSRPIFCLILAEQLSDSDACKRRGAQIVTGSSAFLNEVTLWRGYALTGQKQSGRLVCGSEGWALHEHSN
jgi:hypothetical protein